MPTHVAEAVYNKLPEDTKILFLENDLSNHLNNKECMSNKQGILKAPSHIVMLYDTFHIDCYCIIFQQCSSIS